MMKVAYLLGSLNRGGAENLILDIFRTRVQQNTISPGYIEKKGGLLLSFQHSEKKFINCAVSPKNIIGYIFRLRKNLITNQVTIVYAQQSTDALHSKMQSMLGKSTLDTHLNNLHEIYKKVL